MDRHHPAGFSRQPKLTYVTPDDPLWRRSFINCVEAVSGQKKLNNLYHQYRLIGEELTETRRQAGAVIESGVMTPISDEFFTNFPEPFIQH